MKHMRIPVSDRSPESQSYEGAFFGYVYFWASHDGGSVFSRVEWKSNEWDGESEWTDTMDHGPLVIGQTTCIPFERDILNILNDDYRGAVVQASTPQVKHGRHWVGQSGLVHKA